MPAYNFQKRFAPLVESGQKRQTIRANGKRRHARTGDSLQLYTGMRTKACRKLTKHDPICLQRESLVMEELFNGIVLIHLDGKLVSDGEALAAADGFHSLAEFIQFFRHTHGFPFHGVLIRW